MIWSATSSILTTFYGHSFISHQVGPFSLLAGTSPDLPPTARYIHPPTFHQPFGTNRRGSQANHRPMHMFHNQFIVDCSRMYYRNYVSLILQTTNLWFPHLIGVSLCTSPRDSTLSWSNFMTLLGKECPVTYHLNTHPSTTLAPHSSNPKMTKKRWSNKPCRPRCGNCTVPKSGYKWTPHPSFCMSIHTQISMYTL